MKTLVIHPKDASTDFLSKIYLDKGWDIITDIKISKKKLKEEIKSHDRIVLLGHGTENGLGVLKNYQINYIIDSNYVYLLREKECVCIWCNADKFVTKYGLTGLYTGMIISEIDEAYMYGIRTNIDEIEFSNKLFANVISKYIDIKDIISIKTEYHGVNNEVIMFNEQNIYVKD